MIQIGSYIHDDSQIFFTGNYGHDLSNQRAQQYELFAKKLHPNDTFLFYANRYQSMMQGLFVKPRPHTPKPQTQIPNTKGPWADTKILGATNPPHPPPNF